MNAALQIDQPVEHPRLYLAFQGLQEDVDACDQRVLRQLADDPDHEVALAMFAADLRRATVRMEQFRVAYPQYRNIQHRKAA